MTYPIYNIWDDIAPTPEEEAQEVRDALLARGLKLVASHRRGYELAAATYRKDNPDEAEICDGVAAAYKAVSAAAQAYPILHAATVRLANEVAAVANEMTMPLHAVGQSHARERLWDALETWRHAVGIPGDEWPIKDAALAAAPREREGEGSVDHARTHR